MADIGWSSNTDWTNAQSSEDIDINSGTFELADYVNPDIVSRGEDDSSFYTSDGEKFGLRIVTNVERSNIGAELSNNYEDGTQAYIYRVADGKMMGDTDISGLSAGDTFTIDLDFNLVDGDEYNFVVDAEGSAYYMGYLDNRSNLPYTSPNGDISIVDVAQNETDVASVVFGPANLLRVGDVGF